MRDIYEYRVIELFSTGAWIQIGAKSEVAEGTFHHKSNTLEHGSLYGSGYSERLLEYMGRDGWELTAIRPTSYPTDSIFYFKRLKLQ